MNDGCKSKQKAPRRANCAVCFVHVKNNFSVRNCSCAYIASPSPDFSVLDVYHFFYKLKSEFSQDAR